MKASEFIKGQNLLCIKIGDPKQDIAWFYSYDTLVKMMEEYAQSQLKERDEIIEKLKSYNKSIEGFDLPNGF